jgi:Rhodopirellula transposase DDE domain
MPVLQWVRERIPQRQSTRTIVELISATTTRTGLTVQSVYDPNWYPKGEKITDTQPAGLPLTPHDWHGDLNYTLASTS